MAAEKDPTARKSPGKSSFLSRRVYTFVICLVLSALLWLMQALSKDYDITIRVPVSYTHLPGNSLVAVDLPDSVDVKVTGNGFTLLAYTISHSTGPLDLNASGARPLGEGAYALPAYANVERLEGAIGQRLKVKSIQPDTIILSFQGRVDKKVPVRPHVTVQCAPLFRLGDSVRTIPSEVTVSGAEALVERIKFVETEPKTYRGLDHAVNEPVKLVLPSDLVQASVSPANVQLIVPVAQYTEQRFTIAIEPINVPSNVVLRTFPDKTDVIFQVPIEAFNAIRPEMFRLVVDYSKIDPKSSTIPVEVARQPLNIINLKIEQPQVEYLIRK